MIGTVASLTRYPVKSTGGEALRRAVVEERGVVGDRQWAVCTADGGIGSGKTTRRFRRVDGLLMLTSRLEHGEPVLTFPDGTTTTGVGPHVDALLSGHLSQPLRLCAETTTKHHDESPLHVVTSASLRWLAGVSGHDVDPRRLRPNIVLDVEGDDVVEESWTGRHLRIGGVVLALGAGMPRCVMVNAAQPGIDAAPGLLRALSRGRGTELGVMASVVQPGELAVGDLAELV